MRRNRLAHILFVDMHANTSLARLPALFESVGDQSSALAFKNKILLQTNALKQRFIFPDGALIGSMKKMANALASAQQSCRPNFLMTNDEVFLRNLLVLRRNLRSGEGKLTESQTALLNLLESSLATEDVFYERAVNLHVAKEAGFPTPRHFVAKTLDDIRTCAQGFGFPFYLKSSFESSGAGVTLVSSGLELEDLLSNISQTAHHMGPGTSILGQEGVTGVEFTINFASWNGRLLGYDVVQPLETTKAKGSSSVVQTVYRPQWESVITSLTKRLGYTGLGGIDVFEKKETELPTVIEVNLRPTHSLQVTPQLGSTLIQKFSTCLNNLKITNMQNSVHENRNRTACIFPDELMRDRNSLYAVNTPSNIPWNDPQLLSEFLRALDMTLR